MIRPRRLSPPSCIRSARFMPFLHVIGDRVVEALLLRLTGRSRLWLRCAREQALAVEGEQVLLDEPAHHVVDSRASSPLRSRPANRSGSMQRHEREEVLVLAVVRCRRQQQQMSGPVPEQLAELEALGLVDLVAVAGGPTSCAPRRRSRDPSRLSRASPASSSERAS